MFISFLIFSIGLFGAHAGQRKAQETEYELNFLETVKDCDNFKNEHFSLTELELIQEDDSNWMKGNVPVFNDFNEDTLVSLTVYKRDDITGDFVLYYNLEGDLCDRIEDKEKPWTMLLQAMVVNSCPIKAGDYNVERLSLNVDYGKEYMRHEYIGIYRAKLEMLAPGKGLDVSTPISCHIMDAELS